MLAGWYDSISYVIVVVQSLLRVGKVQVILGEVGSFHKYDKIMILKYEQLV